MEHSHYYSTEPCPIAIFFPTLEEKKEVLKVCGCKCGTFTSDLDIRVCAICPEQSECVTGSLKWDCNTQGHLASDDEDGRSWTCVVCGHKE
jgi:hypothetical protein